MSAENEYLVLRAVGSEENEHLILRNQVVIMEALSALHDDARFKSVRLREALERHIETTKERCRNSAA